jgi:hypothetical protein
MDKTANQPQDQRLDAFTSVQYDPEVWELVQKKFRHFEELNKELESQQSHRRDLLKQLDDINSEIARLQEELVGLSGKDKVAALADSLNHMDMSTEAAGTADLNVDSAPVHIEPEEEASEIEESDDAGPVVGLAPIAEEDPEDDSLVAWPDVSPEQEAVAESTAPKLTASEEQPVEEKEADLAAYEPVVDAPETSAEPEPVVNEAAAQAETPISESPAEPEQQAAEPEPVVDVPSEVAELQKLFDEADDQRRQSDSALKLVQLYDGKAEVFFSAMCRSHGQNGLSEEDARKEAVKDVQTMIATATAHRDKKSEKAKESTSSNPVRRLFSH